VALQTEIKDDNTFLTFKLYDNRYCELYPSQQYEVIIKIYCWGFELSPDEQYLLILGGKEDYKGLFFCHFENGFENDIFIEREMGQHSLDKMSFKPFKLNEFEFRSH
jgi:flavodoxin